DFGLDHWLLTVSQEASFDMDDCQVRPLDFTDVTKRPFKDKKTQKLTFDWDDKVAHYRSPDKKKDFDLDSVMYDPISLFFEGRCEVMAGNKEFSYPVIRKGSKKTQKFKVVDSNPWKPAKALTTHG